jgi:hypothetical protein
MVGCTGTTLYPLPFNSRKIALPNFGVLSIIRGQGVFGVRPHAKNTLTANY